MTNAITNAILTSFIVESYYFILAIFARRLASVIGIPIIVFASCCRWVISKRKLI